MSMNSKPGVRASRRQILDVALGTALGMALGGLGRPAQAAGPGRAMSLNFRGTSFVHRWSKGDQHEFTPEAQPDLKTWQDMVTLNVHAAATNGEQLAEVANRVVGNYQRHGKILHTRSKPRTAASAAEHLIVAVLGTQEYLEATFARCVLAEGSGLIAVCSHRVYGKPAGPPMSEWLKAQGQATEDALMAWAPLPMPSALARLPRSA